VGLVIDVVRFVVRRGDLPRLPGTKSLPERPEVRNGQRVLYLVTRGGRVGGAHGEGRIHASSRRAISWARFPSTRPRWAAMSSFMTRPASRAVEYPFARMISRIASSTSASERPAGR